MIQIATTLEALRQSEARYRALVDAFAGTVWSWAPGGGTSGFEGFEHWWENLTGQSRDDHIGSSTAWLEAVHPDDRLRTLAAWQHAISTGTPYEAEYRVLTRDAVPRYLHARGVPIRGPKGEVQEWVGTLTDVTDTRGAVAERERLHREVESERQKLAEVFHHAPSFTCVLRGPTHVFERVNERYLELLDRDASALLGLTARGAVPEAEGQGFFEILDRVYATGVPYVGTDVPIILRRGGVLEQRFIDFVYQPLRDPDGAVSGIIVQGIDRTTRNAAQTALQLSEERYRLAVQATEDAIWDIDIATGTVHWSERYATAFGRPPETANSWQWWIDRIWPADRERTSEGLRAAIDGTDTHWTCAYRFLRADGVWADIEDHAIISRDATGKARRVVGAMRDVTARKKLEEEFRQSQKMEAFGQLAGGVAHDFNNLLTIINCYSSMFLENHAPGQPGVRAMMEILAAGKRAANLTRQLLAFGRRQVLQPKDVDLNHLIANLLEMLGRLLGEDIRLLTAMSPSLGKVVADPGQLEQVIVNLCVNARDAMPRGGQLTIGTANVDIQQGGILPLPEMPPGRYVRMTVTDTGCGMTDEVKAKAFEPFFTTKPVGQGTGLGLSTVFGIVKQSAGYITVSSAVGRGATFEVYLPIATAVVTPQQSPREIGPRLRGKEMILLVEDESSVRRLIATVLRDAGYTVLEAGGGAEAGVIHKSAKGAVRLLITDVVMPNESGRELAEQLQSADPNLRVLFMSGYTDDRIMLHGIQSSEVAFVQKPFDVEDLLRKVRKVLT